jgi:hypothetical protein
MRHPLTQMPGTRRLLALAVMPVGVKEQGMGQGQPEGTQRLCTQLHLLGGGFFAF